MLLHPRSPSPLIVVKKKDIGKNDIEKKVFGICNNTKMLKNIIMVIEIIYKCLSTFYTFLRI